MNSVAVFESLEILSYDNLSENGAQVFIFRKHVYLLIRQTINKIEVTVLKIPYYWKIGQATTAVVICFNPINCVDNEVELIDNLYHMVFPEKSSSFDFRKISTTSFSTYCLFVERFESTFV